MRAAAIAGATVLAVTSTGDMFAMAALLGLLAADVITWGTATLVALAVLGRWGTTSLRAVSGAQAVLGPAIDVGAGRLVAASWLMAAALTIVSPPGAPALAFGSVAALLVFGPTPGVGLLGVAARVGATVVAVALAAGAGRWVPPRLARWAGVIFAAAAVALVAPGAFR